MTVIEAGGVRLTRVLYLDVLIDPEPTGLTPDEVRAVPWAEPQWAEDGRVRAAACAWVLQRGDRTVVVDPAGNADEIFHDPATTADHQAAMAGAFAGAGIPVDTVDTVIHSHVESVGFTAVRDAAGWRPFFPNARALVSESARVHLDDAPDGGLAYEAFRGLAAAGELGTFADDGELLPGVTAQWTGAHDPGHVAFHVGDGATPAVTFVGHLAVTPVHVGSGPCPPQHFDPERAWELVAAWRADGRWLVGPLWPSPGAARWTGDRLEAYPA